MKASIVIPNWNGKELLQKNLPKVLASNPDEIIVVDDASSDDSVQAIKEFKTIKLIRHTKNLGFVKSVNDGVEEAAEDVVVLLNNDVAPEKDFLSPLLNNFTDKNIFAVSSREVGFSWAWAKFENGFIVHGMGEPTPKPHLSFWASGGSAAFSKEKWQKLGGMDDLYHPFYWEDIDLSYRAAKRGWKILWEPASIVHHNHESTIGKYFSQSFKNRIAQRNQLLFIWKNITSQNLFKQHKKSLREKLLLGQMIRPFVAALLKINQVKKRRETEKSESKVGDEEIFSKFK